ncbi:hypothetical protein P6N53_07850 [Desulforamulus aquiferis]|uniref:Uncharacterized protein n=1 Tax=Desulforamulus aquiferis TaxID=1397668 RepID=A0AAW7ZCF6_9FIRM|nr:hypothetical protein [Desulforamulus aquiferis]
MTVYTKRVPQNFTVPCIYIPPPVESDGSDTVSTFLKTYTLGVKIFHVDSQQAVEKVQEIADAIRVGRYLIPILTQDGNQTGKCIRIKRADVRSADEGVAILSLTWNSRYKYDKPTYEKMGQLKLNENLK